MDFLTKTMTKLSTAVDKAEGMAAEYLPPVVQPKVLEVITMYVEKFRDEALQQVPQSCEDSLRAKAESNMLAGVMNKVMGEHTDVLVAKLIEILRPGINQSTEGLNNKATDMVIEQLRSMLQGAQEAAPAAAAAAPEAPPAEEAPAADQPPAEQAESTSRDLNLGSLGNLIPSGGDGSTSSMLMSLGKSAFRVAFKVDDRMLSFEEVARQQAHPLFEAVKDAVWALIPATVKQAMNELMGKEAPAEGGEAAPAPAAEEGAVPADGSSSRDLADGSASRDLPGFLGKLSSNVENLSNKVTDFANKAEMVVNSGLDVGMDVLEEKVRKLINKLVDKLEQQSMDSAMQVVREKLVSWGLLDNPAAGAAAAPAAEAN